MQDALELCECFGISYTILPLEAPQNAFESILPSIKESPLRLGNLCARMRMLCLYDYAYANSALVVGTSNKSEILLGYGTIYGDLAYAINPIGNLYKTEIYPLAETLKIPQSILQKAPSADLYPGQSDEAELGFSYAILDTIMLLLQKGATQEEILKQGLPKAALELVKTRMKTFAFKRKIPEIAQL